jgi:hypothetical protein
VAGSSARTWGFKYELERAQLDKLERLNDWGFERYVYYRRKGYSVDDAFLAALAWARNSTEQAARRCGHDTGCTRKDAWRGFH